MVTDHESGGKLHKNSRTHRLLRLDVLGWSRHALGFEQWIILWLWLAETAKQTIAGSKVLTIVTREVQVMERVMSRSIDVLLEAGVIDHVRIVDHDAPKIHESKET